MSRKRRVFTDEFKAKVLSEVASGRSMAEVIRQYGLSKNAIYDWRNQAAFDTETVSVSRRALTELNSKVSALERLVGRLSVENDFLKKLEKLESEVDGSEPV
jgi:transposase-like protein